jgi:hypothetical protein
MDDNQNQGKVGPIQVEKYLQGVNYPVEKHTLINHARSQGADQNVVDTLNKLPEQSFDSPIDVSQAIGQIK